MRRGPWTSSAGESSWGSKKSAIFSVLSSGCDRVLVRVEKNHYGFCFLDFFRDKISVTARAGEPFWVVPLWVGGLCLAEKCVRGVSLGLVSLLKMARRLLDDAFNWGGDKKCSSRGLKLVKARLLIKVRNWRWVIRKRSRWGSGLCRDDRGIERI